MKIVWCISIVSGSAIVCLLAGCRHEEVALKGVRNEKAEVISSSDTASINPLPNTVTKIEKGDYSFKLLLKSESKGDNLEGWFGGETDKGSIERLELYYKKERMVIPRSGLADLTDIRELSLGSAGNRAVLTVKGADAGNSYTARFSFIDGDLITRTVKDGEFPDEFAEVTTYINDPIEE